ncbi:MAG: 30S ribosomal protein S13 [Nanoarchaeota archaeon]|nr:30S ribosomal protein S13 [Nanoarchaeota archaeon]
MAEEQKNIKHIVRIANTDLVGEKAIVIALAKINGIGVIYANMVCKFASVDIRKLCGLLDGREIERINDVIANPDKYKVPVWMKDRRKDYDTGRDLHLIGSDLDFTQEQDLRRLKKIKSRRGLRHAVGLPVRGQRTKSNFRRNKGKAMGVKKKSDAKAK